MKSHLFEVSQLALALSQDAVSLAGFDNIKFYLTHAIAERRKILVVGNGASAGEAQRFALAFVTKFSSEHEAYPALSLASDPSTLTAIANDYGFAEEFKRQVEAFGEEGDVLVALSVSGNSDNVIRAVEQAKKMGLKTIGLLGKNGGKMKGMCDAEIVVPAENGARIQEMHLIILDALCAELEGVLK
jgi:D-sedoheptulose 7-phosphate isomerase